MELGGRALLEGRRPGGRCAHLNPWINIKSGGRGRPPSKELGCRGLLDGRPPKSSRATAFWRAAVAAVPGGRSDASA